MSLPICRPGRTVRDVKAATEWASQDFAPILGDDFGGHDLVPAQNDAIGLRVAAVPGVACGIEETMTLAVVEDGRAAIIAAVGVGFSEIRACRLRPTCATARKNAAPTGLVGSKTPGVLELETSMALTGATYPMKVKNYHREIQRQFRFRAEAGDELISPKSNAVLRAVGNVERIQQQSIWSNLVEEYLRGNAETGIDEIIIPNRRVGAIIGRAIR